MLHSRERRRSCRIDFLLGRREGERGGEEKKNERREKRMEEIPVPEGKLQQQQHHRRRPFPRHSTFLVEIRIKRRTDAEE